MTRIIRSTIVVLVASLAFSAFAELRTEHKSRFELAGALGTVVNVFGGKAAREGVTSLEAYKGDRFLRRTDKHGELIDLAEEKVYNLDFGKKTYTVKTFAEIRKELEEQFNRARQETRKEQPDKEKRPEYEFDFDVKETGAKEKINGFDTHEVLITITVRQKGKKLEDGGGGVLTASLFMGPKLPNSDEAAAFQKRYIEKIGLAEMVNGKDIATALMAYPGLAEAMKKLQDRQVRMEGTPIRTVLTMESVASQEQRAQIEKKEQEDDSAPPTSVGGLFGKLGKKLVKKDSADKQAAAGGRVQVLKTTSELLSHGTSVETAEVSVPADFKNR